MTPTTYRFTAHEGCPAAPTCPVKPSCVAAGDCALLALRSHVEAPPIEVAAYDHLERVTAERDRYWEALSIIRHRGCARINSGFVTACPADGFRCPACLAKAALT